MEKLMDFHQLIVREQTESGASLVSSRGWRGPFPEFLLPDEEGWLIWSRELFAQGPFVLAFFHGGWCEACVSQLKQLDSCRHRLDAMGVFLVAASPAGELPRDLKRRYELDIPILSDVDNVLSKELEIAFTVSQPLLAKMAHHGIDLRRRHGSRCSVLPMASTFAVDRNGLAVSVDDTNRARNLDAMIECCERFKRPDRRHLPQHDPA
jgi:peroxiredoxin